MASKPLVTTILLSYNRPRMLLEAFHTLTDTDDIIVVDDGSDFDIYDWLSQREHNEWENRILSKVTEVVWNQPLTVEERLKTPRVGALLNRALQRVKTPYVSYLCDDDLFCAPWPRSGAELLDKCYPIPLVKGRWLKFQDGDEPYIHNPECAMDARGLTTGNFIHSMDLVHKFGLQWDETRVGVHDDFFVNRMHNIFPLGWTPSVPGIVGWRREHEHNMAHFTRSKFDTLDDYHLHGGEYLASAGEELARGFLE